MAIALVGTPGTANSGTITSGTSANPIVVPLFSSAAAGHFALVALHTASGAATVTGPTGWTEHANGDGGNCKIGLWSKVLDASDVTAGSVTIVRSASSVWSATCQGWSGSTGAVDALSAQQASTTATTTPTIPAVTPVAANCLRVGVVVGRVSTSGTASTATPPTSWTEVAEAIDTHATLQRRITFVDTIQLSGQAGVAQSAVTATTSQSVTYQSYSLTLAPAAAATSAPAEAATGSGSAFDATVTVGAASAQAGVATGAGTALDATVAAVAPGPTPGSVVTSGAPRVLVQVAPSGSTITDPNAGAFIVGQSRAGDPVSTLFWANLDDWDQIVSVSIEPGQTGRLDSASPARATVVVENYSGTWDPLNPASPYAGFFDSGMPIRIVAQASTVDTGTPYPSPALYPSTGLFPGASAGSTASYGLFRGYVDDIEPDYGNTPMVRFTCSDQLAALGRVYIPARQPASAGDKTGIRLARILDEGQVPANLRRLDDGVATTVAATYGDWALALAQQVVETEFGELWVDGDGKVIFYERTRLYVEDRSTTVQATFSDSGTDIDMEGLIGARRRAELYNQVTISRDGFPDYTATDAASVAARGPQSFPSQVGTLLPDTVQAASLAGFVLAVFSEPRTKFSEISVEAMPQGMWDVLLPLRRFDRIRAMRTYRPGLSVDVQLLVEGISYAITQDSWQMTISTRDIDSYRPFLVGISKAGDTI